MTKKIFLFIVFLFSHSFSQPVLKDSIYILKDCDFLRDSSIERYFITPEVKIGNIIPIGNSLIDELPVALKSVEEIEHSIYFDPFVLKLYTKPRYDIVLGFEIDANGNVENFSVIKGAHNQFNSSILDALENIQFRPAIYNGSKIKLKVSIDIKINFVFEKYFQDTLKVERKLDYFSSNNIRAFTKFIAERNIPDEVIWSRKAETDIEQNIIYLLRVGMIDAPINTEKQKELTKRYGFDYLYLGCVIPYGYQAYNNKMMEYLNKLNGVGWYQEFWEEYIELTNEEREEMYKVK